MILPSLQLLFGLLVIGVLLPPALAAATVAMSPRARKRMPGGGVRMFKALWIGSLGLFVAIAVLQVFARPLRLSSDENYIASALCALVGSIGSSWLLGRVPWTSQLMKDLADAQRRPPRSTNFGKA